MLVPLIPRFRVYGYLIVSLLAILACGNIAWAQIGEGPWEEVLPIGKVYKSLRAYIHFEDKDKNF
jgi:hypothetical protein